MHRVRKTLLIVDDEELVCRGVARGFRHAFEHICFATHPDEAERILADEEVTDLICDYNLGESLPAGTDLMERWRRAFPQIQRAVLYSGADLSQIALSCWIDFKISKSCPIADLYHAVLLDAQEHEIELQAAVAQ